MAKAQSLEDLNDGRFDKEPIKNKRQPNLSFDSSRKATKDNPKFITAPVVEWTPNSRHLMIHLFYNVIGEKAKKRKDKLPSLDESTMTKFKTNMGIELGKKIIKFRKDSKVLASLKNAMTHVYDDSCFSGDSSPKGKKAVVTFNPLGYDNVERIFTRAGESIPINTSKLVRKAFVTPEKNIYPWELTQRELQLIPIEELQDEIPNS